jgi:hypothetical protein
VLKLSAATDRREHVQRLTRRGTEGTLVWLRVKVLRGDIMATRKQDLRQTERRSCGYWRLVPMITLPVASTAREHRAPLRH